jgi:hypothetical protein
LADDYPSLMLGPSFWAMGGRDFLKTTIECPGRWTQSLGSERSLAAGGHQSAASGARRAHGRYAAVEVPGSVTTTD